MIEVGEYVRSLINGNIYKVIEVSDLLKEPGIKYYKFDEFRGMCSTEEYNTKHSKNIIDLIEVGDYVNGEKIITITNDRHLLLDRNVYLFDKFREIKTILTKEQYEANCYKVKEEK